MKRVVIWSTMGEILHTCEDEEEAEDLISECGYEELHRNTKNDDTNIVVIDF